MTELSLFWDGDSGAGGVGDCGPYDEDHMAYFLNAIFQENSGVLLGYGVTESSPAAKSVEVAAGNAIIEGVLAVSTATETLTIADNVSGNPRIDVVVLEADWTTQTVRLGVVQGTPAAAPVAPTLTQNPGTLWQESLAEIAVANGFVTIVNANITDTRTAGRKVTDAFDAPDTYVGSAGAPLRVNQGEDGIEFSFLSHLSSGTTRKNNSTQVTTTSASFVDVHADFEITLDIKTGRVVMVFVCTAYLDTAPTTAQLTFQYDNTDLGVISYWGSNNTPLTAVAVVTGLSTGSHTFRPRMRRLSGVNTPGIYVSSGQPARFEVWEF